MLGIITNSNAHYSAGKYMVFKRIVGTAKQALAGLAKIAAQAHENRINNMIDSAKGIKKFENGIDCNVSTSNFISYVEIKWVPATVSRTNEVTRLQESQRKAIRVDDAWDNPFPLKSNSFNSTDPILTDTKNERYYRGLLYQNIQGDFFLIAFIGDDKRIRTFQGNDEARQWAEDHLQYEKYKSVFA